ncbi:hypothetical protein B0H16DRAFT_1218366, partial [Mycena metata]
ASAAYLDSLELALEGQPGWMSDICYVLRSLPIPIQFSPRNLTAETVAGTIEALETACSQWLADSLKSMSSRLPLLDGRLERNEEGKFVANALKFRQYLRIPVPAHRKALTRLILSSHTLGVEILRYGERLRKRTPPDFRFCRFCRRGAETEAHAMIVC